MDLSKYYSDYQETLKMREVLKEFNVYIKLADYSYELFRSNYREIINLPEKKCDIIIKITLILDICYELYNNYLNYDSSDTKRHIFYLIFTTELVRDFNLLIDEIILQREERIKIFDKFVNRVDFEKENILKHILDYLSR